MFNAVLSFSNKLSLYNKPCFFQFFVRAKITATVKQAVHCTGTNISMTQLLTRTVAHFTRPSFKSKTNNQPTKKFLSLVVT